MMRHRVWLSAAIGVWACSPAPPPPPVTKPIAKPVAIEKPPPVEFPARWALRASLVGAKTKLPGGATLYGGRGGERWLDLHGSATPKHAATFAPEAIVGIARNGDKELLFLGSSGAIYPTSEPLGAFGVTRKPPAKVRSVSLGKTAILGAAGDALHRSVDFGTTWNKIDLGASTVADPPKAGRAPIGVIAQVVMRDDGQGVV